MRLPADELHVWRVSLAGESEIAASHAILAPDERLRADRFRLPRDRRRFIVARATLRRLLGQTLGCDPAALTFAYGPQGKPALLVPASPLAFNLSHSGDLALIALRWGEAVGVDIEQMRPDLEWRGIADRFFGAGELAWLHRLPPAEQILGFFRLWTRKEAYLKARGEGVWHELSRFDVTRSPVADESVDDAFQSVEWNLHDLDAARDYQAAVCVPGPFPRVRLWQWRPPGPQ